jgi:D-glycero-D-manno-heptose 1,7-bisphosphate phosphatase
LVSDPVFRGRRAAFLDRDGVINIDHGYVFRREDFQFVDGVLAASALLVQRGFALVVITNQSGIGRGLYSEADFADLTAWMALQFADAGAPLAGVYHCPHHPLQGAGAYRTECDCRKPAPGMLLRAARELHLDLARSVLFGDKRLDLEAAAAAGVPVRVLLGTDGARMPPEIEAPLCTARFRSLAEAGAHPALWAQLAEQSHV